jgi:hypothetical protein
VGLESFWSTRAVPRSVLIRWTAVRDQSVGCGEAVGWYDPGVHGYEDHRRVEFVRQRTAWLGATAGGGAAWQRNEGSWR